MKKPCAKDVFGCTLLTEEEFPALKDAPKYVLYQFQWELKLHPGAMSPARGGFRLDDPNQQIPADEDIYDEYGGFLGRVGGE